MKVHLMSGEIIETVGDYPVLQKNGLYRFDKIEPSLCGYGIVTSATKDPLIPSSNVKYIGQV